MMYDAPQNFERSKFHMPLFLFALPALLLQSDDNNNPMGAVAGVLFLTVMFALVVALIAGMWKTFTKAGQPGWGVLIPIYNYYLMTQIAGKPAWWIILMFIPLVNIVIAAILTIGIATSFSKGAGFGIGLFFLPFIFYPVLGFGDATYKGAAAY
jgi:Family of unknown function (DUF5684)